MNISNFVITVNEKQNKCILASCVGRRKKGRFIYHHYDGVGERKRGVPNVTLLVVSYKVTMKKE